MQAFFSNRFKLHIHLLQVLLVVVVLSLSIVRIFNRPAGAPRGRASTMSLGMSAKSLVIMLYQLLTEHIGPLRKWGSLRAYAILNAMEVVFWGAVVYLLIQSNLRFCEGISCTMAWVIIALAIILSVLATYISIVTYLDFRFFRKNGTHRGKTYVLGAGPTDSDCDTRTTTEQKQQNDCDTV